MMKKRNVIIMVALAFAIISCEDKKKTTNTTPTGGDVNLDSVVFTKKTVDETKKDMEKTGTNMVNELTSFNKEPGVNATVNLLTLADNSGSSSARKIAMISSLSAVSKMGLKSASANDVAKALQDDNLSIIEQYDSLAGTYTYNFTKDDWDIVKDSKGTIKLLFPASKASKDAKQNDGKLEVLRPTTKAGPFDFDGQTVSELPTFFKYVLSVGSTEVTTYTFTGAYDDKGVPTDVSSTLTLGTYAFNVSFGYKTTDLKVNYSFKHGNTIILDFGMGGSGNFDKTNIENAKHDEIEIDSSYYFDGQNYVMRVDTYKNSQMDPEKILYNANAHFQLMDIKTAGRIDFKNFYTEAKKIENDSIDQQAALLNKYVDLVVVYASNNQAIAKAEAYRTIENQVIDSRWNQNTNRWEDIYGDVPVLGMRMKFSDGTASDFETYFTDVYNNMLTSLNSFIDELNKTYKWTIEPATAQ